MVTAKRLEPLIGEFDPWAAPPVIEPVTADVNRPLWSVMIPTYNCARYLEKTLESVLSQDPGPEKMEIKVVDDCSTKDDPEEVTRRLGKGRVTFLRNAQNTGSCSKNFNICLRESRGHLVHILHGDDFVLPGFYRMVGSEFEKNTDAGMAINRAFIVDEQGAIDGLLEKETKSVGPHVCFPRHLYLNLFFTPGLVFRREAVEKLGGFRVDLTHSSDWEMTVRVYTKTGAIYLSEPKSCYRMFEGNHTSSLVGSGDNLRDYVRCLFANKASGADVDEVKFLCRIVDTAEDHSRGFKSMGNLSASLANKEVANQISRVLPAKTRLFLAVRKFKQLLVGLLKRGQQ